MRRLKLWASASVLLVMAAAAHAQDSYTAELGWVPIGGAERASVSGMGSATAKLDGSRLSISGSFDGLPANVTAARLHEGAALGARGRGAVVAELRVTGDTKGTLRGEVRLTPEQVAALAGGRLYVQVYSEKGVPPDHDTLFGWLLR